MYKVSVIASIVYFFIFSVCGVNFYAIFEKVVA